ncbi:MAG TPA: VOC family protein [Hyphomonadaceae bacterium]|jgi:catechol 2,3-dioxygenase-like lactoylglutathione lyase family enzyme|nr:VOC family protein [Hyphomonadaceae bacterium]
MITGLDHVLLVCPSIDEGEETYTALLGREPDWRSTDQTGGTATLVFQLENTALEIMAPQGGGPLARRLHALIDQDGAGLKSLIFASDNLEEDKGQFDRRALKPEEIIPGEAGNPFTNQTRYWDRMRLDETATHGVRIFALQRRQPDPMAYAPATPGAVSALDHVVINTANPERAAALYGARLGLRMALDRSNPDWDMRLIFFRTGSLTIELAHKISAGASNAPDRLWGLSWRVPDIEAAYARFEKSDLAITSIRAGRRPGTRVFSVRDGTLGVPTLILSVET